MKDELEGKIITEFVASPRNYRWQKAIAAEMAFQGKIISSKNLLRSLFSLKQYNNKKKP